jgi:hypothetical protein
MARRSGDAEIAAARAHIGWNHPPFEIPAEVYAGLGRQGQGAAAEATGTRSSPPTPRPSRPKPPSSSAAWPAKLPADWAAHAKKAAEAPNAKAETIATRKASQIAINALAPALPEFLGGSADLTGSNLTNWKGCKHVSGQERRQLHFLRRARVRHGRDHERHGPARRPAALRRHLPDVLRIRPQCPAHGGADEAARDPRVHPRFDRPRRRRPDPPAGGADRHACA